MYICFNQIFVFKLNQVKKKKNAFTLAFTVTTKITIYCQFCSLIPGTQKIWMKTWGCSHNNSDGEYMAGQLAASGYKITGKNLFLRQSVVELMKSNVTI